MIKKIRISFSDGDINVAKMFEEGCQFDAYGFVENKPKIFFICQEFKHFKFIFGNSMWSHQVINFANMEVHAYLRKLFVWEVVEDVF